MRLLRQFSLFASALVSALTLVACDGGGTTASLTSIAATTASSSLYVAGPSTQVTVTGYYSDGRTSDLTSQSTFVSSNTSVVTVDSTGKVSPVAQGTAVITATNAGSGKTAATGLITVGPTPPPVLQSLAVTSAASSLVVGAATTQLTVTGTYDRGPTQDLTSTATYLANTAGIVSVSSAGVVTAVAAGTTTITATVSGVSGTSGTITVTVPPPPVLQSIAVVPGATSLVVGGATTQLTVTGTYNTGPTQDLTAGSTFHANTAGVVSISASGVVTPVAAGTTTITATHTASGKTATTGVITVTATAPVLQSIAVTSASSSLTVGGATTQLTVTGTYDTGPTQNLTAGSTFHANTGGVVSISASGVVTPVAAGTTTITATHTASGKTATTGVITVAAGVSSYTILGFNDGTLTYNFDTFGTGAIVATTSAGVPPSAPAGGPAYVKFIRHGAAPGPVDACYSGSTMWASTLTTGYKESIGTIPLSNANSVVQGVVYVPVAGVKYRLKLEDASNSAHYVEIDVTPATTGWQTLSWDAKNFATATFDPTFTFNKLTLFPDFVCGGANPPADETLYVANFTFQGASGPSAPPLAVPPPPSAPTTTAPAPSHPAGNVLSLFNSSGTYTDQAGTNFNAFGDAVSFQQYTVGSVKVWQYVSMNYQGWQFTTANLAAAGYTTMHVDVWTPDTLQFAVHLVNGPAGQTEGAVPYNATTTPAIAKGSWISLDIPLTAFTSNGLGSTTSIYQLLWVDNIGGNQNGTFYIDNVYFWK